MSLNKIILIIFFELIIFYISLFLALFFRGTDNLILSFDEHLLPFLFLFAIYQLIFYLVGFWDKSFRPTIKNIFNLFLPFHFLAILLMGVFFYLFPVFKIAPKTNLVIFALISFILIFSWKIFSYKFLLKKNKKAILFGKDEEIEKIFSQSNFWNIKLEKTIDDLKYLKSENSLKEIDIFLSDFSKEKNNKEKYYLIKNDILVLDTNKVKEEYYEKIDLSLIDENWFIDWAQKKENRIDFFLIRLSDILLSLVVLFFYILFLPILTFLIKKDGGSIFIKMKRVGKNDKIFYIKKFRSMTEGDKLTSHNKQITRIGAFMRKSSLDELPQAWSILKGDMSFVGPRPELEELVNEYKKEIRFYDARHLIRPGLSGWAQVKQKEAPHHSKDTELTEEKLAYDLYYIKNYSFYMYLKVILLTFKLLLNRKNHN